MLTPDRLKGEQMKVGGGQAERDLVGEVGVEVGHVDHGTAAQQLGLDAEVVADRLLGLQVGIGREAEEEPVEIAEARDT